MFLHRVVLGSTVVVAFASSLLQTVVDDVDSETHDATMEPHAQCPTTVMHADFHHDGMQKDRHAHATFHFDPPHDGCYIIEEMHPMLMCDGSKNTMVHAHYGKSLEAVGTVDQTANGGQWAFLGSLQFYAGIPGSVMLSNQGTKPGTLTVFDQVRFTWAGQDCMEVDAHPRRAEILLKVDFQHLDKRFPEFGRNLTKLLASLAHVPENSLRLLGLRSGSIPAQDEIWPIIAEFLVLPNVPEDVLIPSHNAQRNMGYLRKAVAKHAAEICALAGSPSESCNLELEDLGFAKPSLEHFEPHTHAPPPPAESEQPSIEWKPPAVKEERTQQTETQDDHNSGSMPIPIVVCTVVSAMLFLASLCLANWARVRNKENAQGTQEVRVTSAMEAGQPVKRPEYVEENDSRPSTACPSWPDSNEDRQSDSQSGSLRSLGVATCKAPGATKFGGPQL